MKKNVGSKIIAPIAAMLFATESFTDSKPSSPEDVLKQLHRSWAKGAGWAAFGEGSYVRARIHTVGGSTQIRVIKLESRTNGEIKIAFWDDGRTDLLDSTSYSLDDPDFVESNATRLADDSVPIGKKVYPAHVYRFEKSFNVLWETRTRRFTFWLSPDVPGGILRYVIERESSDPTFRSRQDVKLTNLDVPLVVGTKTLHCYCTDSEDTDVDGTVELVHTCSNDSVPDGTVAMQKRVLKGGQETERVEFTVIDYHVEPLKP